MNRAVRVPALTTPPVVAISLTCDGMTAFALIILPHGMRGFFRACDEKVTDVDDGEIGLVELMHYRFHVAGQARVARDLAEHRDQL